MTEAILYLTEIFASIQGETTFSGLPTTFVRLSGCNLRCDWCDTVYSFNRGAKTSLSSIFQAVKDNKTRYVCITGGEPLLQENVHLLMTQLCDADYILSIETGGSLPINSIDPRVKVILDIKCPGSGMEEKNYWGNIVHLKTSDEIKFVIKDLSDYTYAKSICAKYDLFNKVESVLFSPVHDTMPADEFVKWILRDHLPVRLNLQLHKYIWGTLKTGV